ncbi:MAG: C_GCAxxG_C_C family protein [Desulfovibrionaceae bacterium]|jgi:C_GCAxxG_C_C family probable redox protein|nr:C_GCAxxG_C_C family protein [Desulfovibrionaceae bacterium]
MYGAQTREWFGRGRLFCAESVLLAVCRAAGVESPLVPGIATGLCSGIARTRHTCGALTGGVLALGALTGRSEPGGDFERCFALVQEFEEAFRTKWGGTNCFELVGVDFAVPEDQLRFREDGLIKGCMDMVEWTVDTLVDMLCLGDEDRDTPGDALR